MKVKIIDNISVKLLDEVSPLIACSNECRFAVAFVTIGGLSLLENSFQECLTRGGQLEFLVGLDLLTTEPQALWSLYQLSQSNPRVFLYCYGEISIGTVYHPKLYIANQSDTTTIVIGSSNLTEGGLIDNVELNALLEAGNNEEIVSDVYSVYNQLKFHHLRVKPDQEFISIYENLYHMRKDQEKTFRDTRFKNLASQLRKKATLLHHPIPTSKDLFGWQKIVFERLPEGTFSTSDLYKYKRELSSYYPENQNIEAKIRQILQQLRDLGLIRHLGRGIWVKEESADEGSA